MLGKLRKIVKKQMNINAAIRFTNSNSFVFSGYKSNIENNIKEKTWMGVSTFNPLLLVWDLFCAAVFIYDMITLSYM